MFEQEFKPPERVKLGKAKATETVMLPGGIRLFKKAKVKYYIEKRGAREDYVLIYRDKPYKVSILEFKRRFKVIIKSGLHKIEISTDSSSQSG